MCVWNMKIKLFLMISDEEKKIPFDLIDEIEEARKWDFLMNSELVHAMD